MRQYKDLAVVLKRKNFGEADSLVTVFSKNHGKLKILAKGSRKIKSRFMGHIEPFSLVKISVVSGRSFEILTGSQVHESFRKLKEDLKNLPLGNLILEVTDFVSCEKQSSPQVFNLLSKTLSSNLWHKDPETLVLFFFVNLLKLLGFSPHLDSCLKCKNEDLKVVYFSYYWGGILCKNCRDSYPQKKVDYETVEFLKTLQMPSGSGLENKNEILIPEINNSLRKKAFEVISDFFIFINDRKPNSLKFLESSSF